MADIRTYRKENKQRQKREEDYRDKIKKHRLTFFYRILLVVCVITAIIALIVVQYKIRVYEGYDVVSSTDTTHVSGTKDLPLGNNILTYSKDGAHCTDSKGNVLWNQTYGMQSPIATFCQNVAAIGDYNGRTIYVLSENKIMATISTSMPIRDICVASNGVVAAVLEDSEVTWISAYDTNGTELVRFKTTMKNSGYPVSISLSPNGLLCVISYMYVDAGALKSSVAFYNFDEYGQNQIDNFIGGYDAPDALIPYVQYMNNNTAFAVGDDGLRFYTGTQKPEESVYYFDSEVRGVYYNEEYVGLVMENNTGEYQNRLDIYNGAGAKVCSYEFGMDYMDIFFDEDTFVIYNESECYIQTMDGREKYNGSFTKQVYLMMSGNTPYKYLQVTPESIDTIQMK